ncbi:hypothetical protein [Sorangium sp. So ce854]|uniref:hypothetical protein n=1 Tax=Sorangium sp. So ce854 TaxID=3133322 RepID=UPI003F5D604F
MADPRERTQGDAPPVIEAAGLSCRYGDHLALDRLDLTVDAGEIVCLLGANGAGRALALRVVLSLVGIAAPTLALALFAAARLRRSRLIAPPA